MGRIWGLSDYDKDGQLTKAEFNVAMKLVRMALQNQPMPISIPPAVFMGAAPQMMPLHTGGTGFTPQQQELDFFSKFGKFQWNIFLFESP